MKRIYLPNIGAHALVSDDDYDAVKGYRWYGYAKPSDRKVYVRAYVYDKGNVSFVHLHRLVMNAAKGQRVTFKNGNALDCRRSNLSMSLGRSRTSEDIPRPKRRVGKSSRYRGVCAKGDSWNVQIQHGGRYYYVGIFTDEEEAARAYDAKALELKGDKARLNFSKAK